MEEVVYHRMGPKVNENREVKEGKEIEEVEERRERRAALAAAGRGFRPDGEGDSRSVRPCRG